MSHNPLGNSKNAQQLNAADLPTLRDCVHCGLCLPACPTYAATGREAESPRGRIAALRNFALPNASTPAGESSDAPPRPLSRAVHEALDDCLVCRACESACPSGISMESMMAGYRALTRERRTGWGERFERWFLREILPHPRALEWTLRFARWTRALPSPFERPSAERLRDTADVVAPPPATPHRGRIVLFRGCVNDGWFKRELRDAAMLLARAGWEVRLPDAGCCGALHRHGGLIEEATSLNASAAAAIDAERPDFVACDSAGCAAALAEPWDASDAAGRVAERVRDTPSILVDEGWSPPTTRLPGRWSYAPPCHQSHSPLSDAGTRGALGAVLAEPLRDLPEPDHCCGAAGFYFVRRPKLSQSIGARAADRFGESGSDGVISGNPGCLIRWESLLAGRAEVRHPVTLLADAVRGS